MNEPLVSIVVPTLNQATFIEQTLASIVGQNWPRLELIVIDGGSTDGTHAIVERYRDAITHFVSEPDRGQADAINKGFRLARGDVLAWLNSDDYYLPLALAHAVRALGYVTAPAMIYGACLGLYESPPRAKAWPPKLFDREALKTRAFIVQPSTFWTRALWEKTGELNPEFHFVLDWDWFLRASLHAVPQPVAEFLSVYRFHAAHKTSSGNPRRTREVIDFAETHGGPEWGAAFREVAEALPRLESGIKRLRRYRLERFRKWVFRDLYRRHGEKVDVALLQLGL